MLLKILYLLFIFLCFSYSDLRVGGVALRTPILLSILFVIVVEGKFFVDKVWRIYVLFIIVFGVSCIAHGYFDEFSNVLFMHYFISFVGWLATAVVLKKDPSFVKYLVYVILAIGGLDVLVTYSQFTFNSDWYSPIRDFFHFSNIDEFNIKSDISSDSGDVMNLTLIGMFPNGVYNGYFLSLCSILSMFLFLKTRKLVAYLFPCFYLFGSFCCQQRGPFFISVFVIFLLSLSIFSKLRTVEKIMIIIGIGLFVTLGVSLMNYSESMDLRYSAKDWEDDSRLSIYTLTLNYIQSKPFTANFYELVEVHGKAPHNLFLNAAVYGGFVSFFIIMWILFFQAKHVWKIIRNRFDEKKLFYYVFSYAWIAFTLNSMVHNRSIVTGDFMIWVIWGVLTVVLSRNNKQLRSI